MSGIFDKLTQYGVIPVIAIENEEHALPLADALLEGGLPVAEITFRTACAAKVIRLLTNERPDLLVGAGTLLSAENVEAAVSAGARFAVAPGLNPEVIAMAIETELPFAPGVATASDIELALACNCKMVKFFPSEPLGGVKMIKALVGPYGHTGVQFIPTGGVNADNLATYLQTPCVAACGGTWIAKRDDLAEGRWDVIRDRAKQVAEIVAGVR
jgi:2-dehydro-3-deoxyphosphogluconate aldolase / (4S)-4-hydroxy-2-oxoglutarate aldolase